MTRTAGPTVAFSTLGCKVNYSEAEALGRRFLARGYRIVPFEEAADVYVVNTCTVTHVADRKSRGEIRAAARRNPAALVAATGCYVSVANHGLEGVLPGNVLIVANAEKDRLVDLVERARAERMSCTGLALETDAPTPPTPPALPVLDAARAARPGASSTLPVPLTPATLAPLRAAARPAALGRTRANLKVQDGCNAGCAFCIIPRARGGPRSVPLAEAVDAARRLEEWGYREIVVSGVLLGSYGRDLPEAPRLRDLVAGILDATRDARVRLSSIEPQDVDRDLFALWRGPHGGRLCRHLHLPLQSGSTPVLRAMRRMYDAEWYAAIVRAAAEDIPGVAVTIDMMVGFPSEDEALFEESYRFAERLPLAGMHVFPYSARRGTAAATFGGQVPASEKARRGASMRALAARQSDAFRRRHLDAILPVLWEEECADGMSSGLTDNYLRVYSRDGTATPNTLARVRLVEPYQDGVLGVRA